MSPYAVVPRLPGTGEIEKTGLPTGFYLDEGCA